MIKVKIATKSVIIILLLLVLTICNFSFYDLKVNAADDKYVKQIYVGQPTDSSNANYGKALYIKVNVVGYEGKRLRIRIKSSDGTELYSTKLSNAISNNTTYHHYWSGKDSKGNFYKDGKYTIQTWIYGDDSTLVTKTYTLDLKGNDTTIPTALKKSAKVTYMGQPDDKNSKYYNYAMLIKMNITGYKGKVAQAQLYDPSGKLAAKITFNITKDNNPHNWYYRGYDTNGNWTGNGTYKVKLWVDGAEEATEDIWSNKVTLKTTNAKHFKITSLKTSDNTDKGKYVTVISTAGYKGETVVVGYKNDYDEYFELNKWSLTTNSPENWKVYLDANYTNNVVIIAYVEGYSDSTYRSQSYSLNK
jgi:flagellar hook assembly protein FlgD